MARRTRPSIRQYETHRQLAGRRRWDVWRSARAGLDAIIVPASRTADNLEHAVALAREVGCWLVVLCSRQTRAADVDALFSAQDFGKGIAVDVPADYCHPLLSFTSSDVAREASSCANPNGDLSTKRNLGLLLARLIGWNRVFFMDDDIREVSTTDLRATVSMLDQYWSAAMRVTHFADNSVVCHAHRATGAEQDVFVSGSVLAVDCQRPVGFFPEIYNEDWLFFFDDAHAGKLGWSGCEATQLPYDPFENTERAERQEFGDVLAEGLYALLHVGSGSADATHDYWDKFLAKRKEFVEDILDRSYDVAPEIRQNVVRSVVTAEICLMQFRSEHFVEFLAAWRRDLDDWQQRLETMGKAASVEAALDMLGLSAVGGDRRSAQAQPGMVAAAMSMLAFLAMGEIPWRRTSN